VRLFAHQLRAEQKLFWRSRELAFFTFLLPILFYLLLSSAYGGEDINSVSGYQYLLAGMIGYGAASTTFAGLALLLVIRRESGVLKRLRATPLPPETYVAAVLASIILVFVVEAAILLAIGRFGFDVPIADSLPSLVLVVLLGACSFAALGVGLTALIRSAEGSSAVVNALYLPLSFISGAFFSEDTFPEVLQTLAAVLPLSHLIQLTRDVMVFDDTVWQHLDHVAVVAAWGVVGVVVAVRGFRWEPRER
jgi:ABC-2 type transport system permease protein